MSNGPAGTGMALSSVRYGFPFARDTRGTPSLAPSGSCFACLGGGAAWVAVLFGLRIHRHSSHGQSVYTRLCFLHQITVPIVSYPHFLLPHRLLHAIRAASSLKRESAPHRLLHARSRLGLFSHPATIRIFFPFLPQATITQE